MKQIKSLKWILIALLFCNSNYLIAKGFSNIYVLGDSLSDQGNLFTATESVVGIGLPAKDNYYMGRFANAENYVGFLASRLGIELTPSIFGGNNFAYGGARADYNSIELDETKPTPVNFLGQSGFLPENLFPWTLNAQSQAFNDLDIYDPEALFIIFSGSNDLADLATIIALSASSPVFEIDISAYIENVVESINQAIGIFVDAGANDILIPNIANLGLVPEVTQVGPSFAALTTGLTLQYNQTLDAMLEQWEDQVNIIKFDSFSLTNEISANPAKFGFSNSKEACYTGFVLPADPDDTVCDNPDEYVFWDNLHPTSAVHEIFADRICALTITDILDDLIRKLSFVDLHHGIRQSLTSKLLRTSNMLQINPNNNATVTGLLGAFTSQVKSMTEKNIEPAKADFILSRVELIFSLLRSCPRIDNHKFNPLFSQNFNSLEHRF